MNMHKIAKSLLEQYDKGELVENLKRNIQVNDYGFSQKVWLIKLIKVIKEF